ARIMLNCAAKLKGPKARHLPINSWPGWHLVMAQTTSDAQLCAALIGMWFDRPECSVEILGNAWMPKPTRNSLEAACTSHTKAFVDACSRGCETRRIWYELAPSPTHITLFGKASGMPGKPGSC